MAEFILQLVLVISGGVFLYLVARTLPRLDETDTTPPPRHLLPEWTMHYLERADEEFVALFEKLVRKFRVALLKIDNTLSVKLNKMKKNGAKENGLAPLEGDITITEERERDDNAA